MAEMETQVVNIRAFNLKKMGYSNLEEWVADPNHIYIGRGNPYVKGAFQSKWANPFTVKKYSRDECIKLYEQHITSDRHLMAALHELKGKTLGCWCHPEPCHGHILQRLISKHC
ncbi:hypothetical protein ACJMK2_011212 [Sinanodonta woodiana]|uniref:DUF4326 domain-containing protein n=1 Tax=Sinanodonta woodiana TaxID=1069815 RepID=A0ABD3V4T5_SINWO